MVKKKSVYWKNLRRSTLKSKSRFLSIFSIVFLGAAFFAGLRNTPGTMMLSMDDYLDKYNFADLTYIVSLGFSEDDIKAVEKTEGIDKIEYGYQFDALMSINNQLSGIKVYTSQSFHDEMINQPDLKDGRYPTKDNECVIDELMVGDNKKIGDFIEISNDQGKKKFEIVGIVNDPRFIADTDRGTNSLGDGTNAGYIEILNQDNAFLAMPKDLYDLRDETVLYNQISVSVKGAEDYNIFSDDYDEYIETVNTKIKSSLSLRSSDLYEKLTSDANSELSSAEDKYNDGLDAYTKGKNVFEEKILKAKIQLTEAKMTLASKEAEFLKGQGQANQQQKEMAGTLEQSAQQLQKDLDALKKQLEEFQKNPTTTPPNLEGVMKDLESISKMLNSTSSALNGLSQLTDADLKIQQAKLQIQQQENKLTLEELKTRSKLEDTKNQLDVAKGKINQAHEDVDKIPKGKLYTLTCHENAGVMSYDANTDSISSIANVFPLMFFLVAALVSLTTMTRMVEEQRNQNGTLRALGYSKTDIIKQYVVYVILATSIACALGIVVGTQFFPRIICYLYNLMLFKVDVSILIFSDSIIALQTVFISVVVTMIATLSVCLSELNLMPAVLMRPKSPKIGKRIVLERINFIWKRLSFNHKVTMRNIFRYKKRFLMSIIGIAGCTALIITGFGIRSSVSQIVDLQYSNVFTYDAVVRLEDEVSVNEAKKYQTQLLQRDEVNNVEYVLNQSVNLLKNKEDLYASMIVYQSLDNIQNFIHFEDFTSSKNLTLDDDGVIISAKTAELLKVDEGDTIDVEINGDKYNVKIAGVMKNYFMNYIYMSQNLYEELTSKDLKVNHAFMTMKKLDQSYKTSIEDYMKEKGYGNISAISSYGSDFNDEIKSIDIVVVILIICAGALSFIVLYNLTNINIQERKSEIATIKVLGFRRKEVYDYIFRENIILSMIGSLVGLVFGYFLHQFIIRTVELEVTMFVRTLDIYSYLYAFIITMGFTFLINYTMRRVLNKVDMVESLKSIE
ncbi:MAG: FtsX-like permease family protein [Coprobacillus sp.]